MFASAEKKQQTENADFLLRRCKKTQAGRPEHADQFHSVAPTCDNCGVYTEPTEDSAATRFNDANTADAKRHHVSKYLRSHTDPGYSSSWRNRVVLCPTCMGKHSKPVPQVVVCPCEACVWTRRDITQREKQRDEKYPTEHQTTHFRAECYRCKTSVPPDFQPENLVFFYDARKWEKGGVRGHVQKVLNKYHYLCNGIVCATCAAQCTQQH